MKQLVLLAWLLPAFVLTSCVAKQHADLIVFNGHIYTVDSSFSRADAMVIRDGKIIATGSQDSLENIYSCKERVDANGQFIYPGFIDAHAHFVGYAQSLQRVNLEGTTSWAEAMDRIRSFAATHTNGWLLGRGWDQNDWANKEFPDNSQLNKLFPDRPVLLVRIDGHAALANQQALNLAGVSAGQTIAGGEIEVKNRKLTGILVDNAVDLVSNKIPSEDKNSLKQALMTAEKNCFAVGLTTLDDCGLDASTMEAIRALQDEGSLQMRMYIMLSDAPDNFNWLIKNGTVATDRLTVRAIKVYADGALGSRGACLLKPYHDKPGWSGFLLSSQQHFDSVAALIHQHGWQMCTHAIGDSGNRTILRIYAKYLQGKNDLRWRIEHAQVVAPEDVVLFGDNNVIPSVQPTHATSDMYWAGDRLGEERLKSAYAYQQLLAQNGWLPLGTDFPVEDISPFKTFYAAVVRKDAKGWPGNGFQTENALTREQALRGMTIWAARANFEETKKGSLEKGKWADFVLLDKDLMTTPPEQLLGIRVSKTFIAGKMVYQRQ